MKNSGKVLIHFDNGRYGEQELQINEAAKAMQDLLNEFNAIGGQSLFSINSIDEVIKLGENTAGYLKERLRATMVGQKFNGFEIDPDQAASLIKLPSLTKLIELSQVRSPFGLNYFSTSLGQHLTLNGSKVIFSEERKHALKESYCLYASNADQVNAIEKLKDAAKALTDLQKALGKVMNPNQHGMLQSHIMGGKMFSYDAATESVTVNMLFHKSYRFNEA